MKRLLPILAFMLLTICVTAQVNNYYVSPSGNDTNSGTSIGTPWRTLQHANAAATLGLAGTVINVAPGTYGPTSGCCIPIWIEGKETRRVTWVSTTPLGAVINGDVIIGNNGHAPGGDYNTIQGFTCTSPNTDDCFTVGSGGSSLPAGAGGGNFVSILNNYIHDVGNGSCGHGAPITTLSITHDVLIDGNRINRAGIQGGCDGGSSDHGIYVNGYHNTITNNQVSNVAGAGIMISGNHNSCQNVIANNTVFHNYTGGIAFGIAGEGLGPCGNSTGDDYNTVTNNLIIRNSFGCGNSHFGNYAIGWSTGVGFGATHNKEYNNLMAGNFTGSCSPTNNTFSFLNGNTDAPTHAGDIATTTYTNIFVNYQDDGSGDYHLLSTSPAVDMGMASNSTVCAISPGISPCLPTTDFEQKSRNAPFSIGAFELTTVSNTPPSAPTNLAATVQ